MHVRNRPLAGMLAAVFALSIGIGSLAPALADDPGITPTEILLGGLHPYSGPASAYGAIGKGISAYFSYVNDKGGVNGRKITYKDLDDAYSPPQAVQLTKQLVEQDKVFAMFDTLGTPSNLAIRQYLNDNGVPQLYVATGASTWGNDGAKYPWTIGWQPDYQSEAIVYARYLLKEAPGAKIGVLMQNDDYGEDYLAGLKQGLGSKADSAIVKTATYEVTDASISSQVATLKASGADTFFIFATPKFSIQALVAAAQQSWKPRIFFNSVSASQTILGAATKAGGVDATKGLITTQYLKDPSEPRWANDAGIKLYRDILSKYAAGADPANGFYIYGMSVAYTMVDTLKRAGKNPTRKAVMDIANHLHETDNPFTLPGIAVETTPKDRFPIDQQQLAKYDGAHLSLFGDIIAGRGRGR
jgi:branched-chain amino acid transport system substrate-binding protein